MRLLQIHSDGNISLVGPFARQDTPRYGILSHTWGAEADEVTFADFQSGLGKSKVGYEKIAFCQRQATAHGIDHFWIDTCCIDKTSSAELTEAINSMYRWYQKAERCYVYLQDVSTGAGQDVAALLRSCRWMTRGWTLQELLAPSSVEFFSAEGTWLRTRDSLAPLISEITTIPMTALASLAPLTFSHHEKMRWGQRRTTKVEEDMVYCMLGLFDVSIPLIYGEGFKNALVRLDGAIASRSKFSSSNYDESGTASMLYANYLRDAVPAHSTNKPVEDRDELGYSERRYLNSLWYAGMRTRHIEIDSPMEGSSTWLFERPEFIAWAENLQSSNFLWLRGNPGVGKSVLVKEVFARFSTGTQTRGSSLAAYFFNKKGHELERSPLGLFRSIYHQLLLQNRDWLRKASRASDTDDAIDATASTTGLRRWTLNELGEAVKTMLCDPSTVSATILVDALDECVPEELRRHATFWSDMVSRARVRVLISCRHYPSLFHGKHPMITVETANRPGIDVYVNRRLEGCIENSASRQALLAKIKKRAQGVFLWVALALDMVLEASDEGHSFAYLARRLDSVPDGLATLFDHMLSSIRSTDLRTSRAVMSWVVFARKPLRVDEWYHIMAVVQKPQVSSLSQWRSSETWIETDDQLEKRLRTVSGGLVEIGAGIDDENRDTDSAKASAGSLDFETGGTRFVQVIHSSICDYLQAVGLPTQSENLRVDGHVQILKDCLHYITLAELDEFVDARQAALRSTELVRGHVGEFGLVDEQYSIPTQDLPGEDTSTSIGTNLVTAHEVEYTSMPTLSQASIKKRRRDSSAIAPLTPFVRRRSGKKPCQPAPRMAMVRSGNGIDVVSWLHDLQPSVTEVSPEDPQKPPTSVISAPSSVRSTGTSYTRVMQDYMALLPYITAYFWEHARLLQLEDHVPEALIKLFCKAERWHRWQALDDHAPYLPDVSKLDLQCAYFEKQGLQSWSRFARDNLTGSCDQVLPWSESIGRREPSLERQSRLKTDLEAIDRSLRRRGSVSSFSSASSHCSSVEAWE